MEQNNPIGLEQMLTSLPLLPWEDGPDGAATWLGPQWETYAGRPVQTLLGWGWLELLHPEDRERTAAAWAAARQGDAPYEVEMRIRAADGSYRWFLVRGTPIKDPATGAVLRWVGSCTDVEPQKALAARVEAQAVVSAEQATLLETIIRTAPVGIAFFDSGLRHLQINDALARMNGLRAEEQIGRTLGEALPNLAPAMGPLIRSVFATGVALMNREISGSVPAEPGRLSHRLVSLYPVRRPGEKTVEAVGVFVSDITAQTAVRREQAVLARVAAALNTSFHDLEAMLTIVAEGAAELFETPSASVFLLAEDGATFALYARTASIDAAATPPEARDRGRSLAGRVLAAGRPGAIEDTTGTPELFFPRIIPASGQSRTAVRPRAVLAAPILHQGAPLGAVEVCFETPRTFDAQDRQRLAVLSDQAAVAIANAEAYARERAARAMAEESERRAQVVAEVAQALSQPVSLDAVLEAATETLAGSFSGGGSGIWLHDPADGRLRLAASQGYSAGGRHLLADTDEGSDTVVTEAFRRRDVVIYHSDDPSLPALTRRLVSESGHSNVTVAATPLVVAGGVLGAMSLISRGHALDASWVETLRAVGTQVAAAVERARLYDQARGIASRLQGALLPALEDEALIAATGLAVAHRYRPGTEGMTVGGDFYDVWSLAGEWGAPEEQTQTQRLAVVLGDISGKGLEAAAQTAAIRHAVLAYAHEDPSPATVVSRVNDLSVGLNLLPSGFATMFFATVDAATGQVDYCSAGHESLLLRSSAGVTLLEATAPVLGLAPGGSVEGRRVTLEPGGQLVLYTDGITEARDPRTRRLLGVEGLTEILDVLTAELGERPTPAAVAAGLLTRVEAYAGGHLEDDAALLVIARPEASSLATAVATSAHLEKT